MARNNLPDFGSYDPGRQVRFFDSNLALANSDPVLMARGLVDGISVVHKFGGIKDVGTAFKTVTESGFYRTPTTATSLELVSSSTADNGTSSPIGSGATKVRVYGIADWTVGEVTEDVTLNGTSAVALSTSFLRVYRMQVIESGTYATAVAPTHNSTITLRETGGGDTWATITAQSNFGLGQTEIGAWSAPANKEIYIPSLEIFVESNKSADVILFVRENADTIAAPYSAMQAKEIFRGLNGEAIVRPLTPIGPFYGPCDIGFLGEAASGTANIEVDFELLVVDA